MQFVLNYLFHINKIYFNFVLIQIQKEAKVILIGESGTGKTCIAIRQCQQTFRTQVTSTISASFMKTIVKNGNTSYTLNICDTCGQEKHRSLTTMYLRGTQIALVVFDVTRKETVEATKYWMKELKDNNIINGVNHCVVAVVANKIDCQNRVVTRDQGLLIARAFHCQYYECSAKSGMGVTQIFNECCKQLESSGYTNNKQDSNQLVPEVKGKSGGCC